MGTLSMWDEMTFGAFSLRDSFITQFPLLFCLLLASHKW